MSFIDVLIKKYKMHFLCCLVVSACSSQPSLTVYSEPSSALVMEMGGGASGYTPATFAYDIIPEYMNNKTGCYSVQGFEVTWQSGAKASTDETITLCGIHEGNTSWHIVLKRPDNYPGLKEDVRYAYQVLQQKEAEQQRYNRRMDALWGGIADGLNEGDDSYNARRQSRTSPNYSYPATNSNDGVSTFSETSPKTIYRTERPAISSPNYYAPEVGPLKPDGSLRKD